MAVCDDAVPLIDVLLAVGEVFTIVVDAQLVLEKPVERRAQLTVTS